MSEERTNQLREASGTVVYTDALTSFLYELMRDHLPAGVVEKLVRTVVEEPEEKVFTNGWLAKYANNLAEELKNAKTNNLAKILSEAFGDAPNRSASESRPSFKNEEERADDSRKVIDTLVNSGQLTPQEAEEIKKEIEEFEEENKKVETTVYVGGGEPTKEGESVVITTNENPNLQFNKE